jgi:four helix bundle protein
MDERARMQSLERLDAYRVAKEFLSLAVTIRASLPRGHAEDADQLERAAKSAVRNIAEGAGRRGATDKARAYAIARGEAMECAGAMDVLRAVAAIDDDLHAQGNALLERVVSMLTKLIKKPQ